jgi:hypothetical protein
MTDPFDTNPVGYRRAQKRGWLTPARTPQQTRLAKMAQENKELRIRLEAIEAVLLKEKDNGR